MPFDPLSAAWLLPTPALRAAEDVRVEFRVAVPKDTPADARIYLAGNLPALGRWRPDGVALKRDADGRYSAVVALPKGARVEYKVTRGSWRMVEKDRAGRDVANRTIEAVGEGVVDATVAAWSAPGPNATVTGTLRLHADVPSKHLDHKRTVAVWLPPGYADRPAERYPVFYLHDGQNVFDAATAAFGVEWQADETAHRLITGGKIRPVILVGVYNTPARLQEYAPPPDGPRRKGGTGDAYGRFLVEELKPFMDRTYRTRPERESTAVGGSSMGGLISLHLAATHPDVFSMCAALSPSLWWGNESVLRRFKEDTARVKRVKFWIDTGDQEGTTERSKQDGPRRVRRLAELLKAAGLAEGRDYRSLVVEGGEHNEAAWAGRFDQVLLHFFGK
jgi:predicted alpha/beta superfamily hydrolase